MKFLVDRMLGKLAKGLRMLGYDTIYFQGEDMHQLFHLAREEGRVILTRNSKLTPRRPGDCILRIQEDLLLLQLKELVHQKYITLNEETLFSRCLLCNTLLDKVPREEVEGKVPDFIFYQQENFFRCSRCRRIYWPGSHQENMRKKVGELLG